MADGARPALTASEAIDAFLRALGHDPSKEHALRGTGARVATLFADQLLDGRRIDPASLCRDSIPVGSGAPMVVLRHVATHVVCPHHLMPALGYADLAYFPGDRVLGLGALGELVDACAHRLVLQEDASCDVARALVDHLGARGAACAMTLRHGCLTHHPPKKRGAKVTTLAFAGSCAHEGTDRQLVIAALGTSGATSARKKTSKAAR